MLVFVSECGHVYVKVTEFWNCLTVKLYFKSSVTLISTLSYRMHAHSVTVIMNRNSSVKSYICYHPRLGLGRGAMTQFLRTIRTRERLSAYFHFLYLLKYGPLLLQSYGIILAVFCGWFYECKPKNWALLVLEIVFLCNKTVPVWAYTWCDGAPAICDNEISDSGASLSPSSPPPSSPSSSWTVGLWGYVTGASNVNPKMVSVCPKPFWPSLRLPMWIRRWSPSVQSRFGRPCVFPLHSPKRNVICGRRSFDVLLRRFR
jgi:hypothetical protein